MLPIVDKPSIQFVIEEAVAAGMEDILIITGRGKRAIEDHFDHNLELEHYLLEKNQIKEYEQVSGISSMARIHYIRQKEPKGLGHAVLCAKDHVGNEPFAVFLGDDIVYSKRPCISQLLDIYNQKSSSVVALEQIPWEQTHKYGVVDASHVLPDPENCLKISSFVEKPDPGTAPSNLAIIGRYILTPQIFEILESTKPGKKGEIQLTDALITLNLQSSVYGCVFQGKRYDIGSKLGYIISQIEYGLRHEDVKKKLQKYLKTGLEEILDSGD
jgi:UTP--glucose-1-phosphate uridylyltransferase